MLANLSHLTVSAPNHVLYSETIEFYGYLGFKLISRLEKESWLHLFPSSSENPSIELKDTSGITLRVLNEDLKENEFDLEAFQNELVHDFENLRVHSNTQVDGVPKTVWGTFVVGDILVRFISQPFSFTILTRNEVIRESFCRNQASVYFKIYRYAYFTII